MLLSCIEVRPFTLSLVRKQTELQRDQMTDDEGVGNNGDECDDVRVIADMMNL